MGCSLLPLANEVWGKVMILTPVCYSVHSRGAILSRKVPSIVGVGVLSLTGGVLSLAGGAVLSKGVL